MSRTFKLSAGLVATLVLCSACVHQKDPSVQVKALQADIVFGLRASTTTTPPPAPAQPAPPSAGGVVQAPVGNERAIGSEMPFRLPFSLAAPTDCPAAALDAFPDQTAPVRVTVKPTVGAYKWELGGDRVEGISILPVKGEETRLVRRVAPIAPVASDNPDSVDYTFQVVEPYDQKGDVLALTYQARTDNKVQRYEQPQTGGTETAYVTNPDSGLALVAEDVIDRTGGVTPVFHPTTPLLILPLPIQPGGQFTSVAADPASGNVVTLQATVQRRARVDACGTVIEGWDVSGLEQVVAPPSPSSGASPSLADILNGANSNTMSTDVDDIYATQFGAMPIAEHTLQSTILGTVTVDDAIGQEKPSPLPPGTA